MAKRWDPTICAAALWRLLELVQERGVPMDLLIRTVGLTQAHLDRTGTTPLLDRRIPFSINDAIWDFVMKRLRDPGIPIDLSRPSKVEHFSLYGFLMKTSPTVAAAGERARRYLAIWTERGGLNIETHGDTASIVYRHYDNDTSTIGARCACETVMADVTSLLRQLVNDSALKVAVTFQHAAPSDITTHERFFKGEVRFGASNNAVTFPAKLLELELPAHDAGMLSYFEGQADSLLAQRSTGDDLIQKTSREVANLLPSAEASLDRVAKALAMSGRTLRRHLTERGTTFDDLLVEVRRDLAERYLRDPRLSIAEVALLLGFAEQASFHRAYRRWTGQTPGAARTQLTS